jgi:hypothetical protein
LQKFDRQSIVKAYCFLASIADRGSWVAYGGCAGVADN